MCSTTLIYLNKHLTITFTLQNPIWSCGQENETSAVRNTRTHLLDMEILGNYTLTQSEDLTLWIGF